MNMDNGHLVIIISIIYYPDTYKYSIKYGFNLDFSE